MAKAPKPAHNALSALSSPPDLTAPADLHIVHHPAEVLRIQCAPVTLTPAGAVPAQIKHIIERMAQVMRGEKGIGLAAPQIGVPLRIFIADVPEDEGDPEEGDEPRSASSVPPQATRGIEVYINPVLSEVGKLSDVYEEGCLSLPQIRGRVRRPIEITITANGLTGTRSKRRGAGLLARCWQHECDHLDGILILDRMLNADRLKNRRKIKALEGDN